MSGRDAVADTREQFLDTIGSFDILCDPDGHFMAQFPMWSGEKVSRVPAETSLA